MSKIYIYSPSNFELVAELDYVEGNQYPTNSTLVVPPVTTSTQAAIFNPQTNLWSIVNDYRNTTVYSLKYGTEVKVVDININLAERGLTLIPPAHDAGLPVSNLKEPIQSVVLVDPSTGGTVAPDSKGSGAATITTNTTAVTGTFVAISCITDTVFTSLTRTGTTGSLGTTVVPSGFTIFGTITGYQLASGAVIAYGA
jgi:hypothetical protein